MMISDPRQAATYTSAARIGRWIVPAIPYGWVWIPGFGIQQAQGAAPGNVFLKEDELLAGNQLALYIQAQITLMKRTFLDPAIAGPAPLTYPGATEAALLMIKHQPNVQAQLVFQVQHYIRVGRWIGIATLTTLSTELLKARGDFDEFMKQLRVDPEGLQA